MTFKMNFMTKVNLYNGNDTKSDIMEHIQI